MCAIMVWHLLVNQTVCSVCRTTTESRVRRKLHSRSTVATAHG